MRPLALSCSRRGFVRFAGAVPYVLASASIFLGCQSPSRAARVPRLGILLPGVPAADEPIHGFYAGLQALGYTDGRNITLDARYAHGDEGRLPELVADIPREPTDLIVAATTLSTLLRWLQPRLSPSS